MTNETETTTEDRADDTTEVVDAAATPTGEPTTDAPDDAADVDGDRGGDGTPDHDPDPGHTSDVAGSGPAEQAEQAEQADAASELAEEEHPDWEQRATEDGRTSGQLLEALEEAQSDRDGYLDALQRSRAEFDNFRRRSAREAAGARAAGVGDLAIRLLDVLDDLDRTVKVAETSDDEGLAAGITAVRRKLVDTLLAAGVERVEDEGVPFDATRHEAVQKIDAEEDLDEPEVAQVLRPGYVHGARVLRPAMVSVRQ